MSGALGASRQRVTSDVLAQLSLRLVNLALGVVVTVILVRTLGDEGFGKWATLYAIIQIATNFGELGLEQVAVTRASSEPEREMEWMGALITVRAALGLLTALMAAVVVVAVARDAEMLVAGLILTGTLVLSAPAALRIAFQLRVRNRVPTAVTTFNNVLWTGGAAAIAAGGGRLVPLAAMSLGALVASTSLQWVLALRTLGKHPPLRSAQWVALLRVGALVGLAGVLTIGYVRLDQILVFELAGAHEASLYGAIYRVLDQAQFIPIVLMTTLTPILSAAWATDRDRGWRLFGTIVRYLVVAGLPALTLTIAAGEPIVRLVFGPSFEESARALPVLMGAFVLIAVSYPVDAMLVILGLQRRFALHAAIGLAVNVSLNLLLIPPYGFVAAAWVTLLTEVIVLGLNVAVLVRHMDRLPPLAGLIRAALAATLAGVVAYALQESDAALGVVLGGGVGAYGALVLALGAVRPAEVRALLASRREDSAGD